MQRNGYANLEPFASLGCRCSSWQRQPPSATRSGPIPPTTSPPTTHPLRLKISSLPPSSVGSKLTGENFRYPWQVHVYQQAPRSPACSTSCPATAAATALWATPACAVALKRCTEPNAPPAPRKASSPISRPNWARLRPRFAPPSNARNTRASPRKPVKGAYNMNHAAGTSRPADGPDNPAYNPQCSRPSSRLMSPSGGVTVSTGLQAAERHAGVWAPVIARKNTIANNNLALAA
jgi:hypothetical protein